MTSNLQIFLLELADPRAWHVSEADKRTGGLCVVQRAGARGDIARAHKDGQPTAAQSVLHCLWREHLAAILVLRVYLRDRGSVIGAGWSSELVCVRDTIAAVLQRAVSQCGQNSSVATCVGPFRAAATEQTELVPQYASVSSDNT